MATKKFTDEELNYFRLCYVIVRKVPEGLRTVFKQQWNACYQATHGQWLDAPTNATEFLNMESPRNQRRNARLLTIMANGNTNEWDCTCLFYAILYSDCLGPFLNITVQKNVNELREIRNKAFAHTSDGRLADVDFEDAMRKISVAFNALGLDTTQVDEMKTHKSFLTAEELSSIQQQLNTEKKLYHGKLQSFCVLPPKPSHDTTHRADEAMTINHEMEKLRRTNKNETTVIYLSGNPGCGKSEIARQIGNNHFNKIPEDTGQLKFVFTFNASSIDTLLQSYEEFAVRLGCEEDSFTRIATSNYLSPEEKIKKMKSLINPKLQNYSSWLIIVDNVNDLKLVSKYLPQAGEKTSGDGQILITTQDSQSIPLDSYTYHYSSLKSGMKEEDAIVLLSQVSGCTGDRDTLLNIASALDFQPLALACAAVYMKRILNGADQSEANWEKYLVKLKEGKREATEKVYEKTTPTYQSAMTAAVRLALERVVSEDKNMMHAFQFLSVIANEPIPLNYVVQYVINCMPDEDQDLVAAHISLSSLVISFEDEDNSKVIRVHQVVYHGLRTLFENNQKDILKLMSVFSDLVSFENFYNVTKAEIIASRSFAPHFVVLSRNIDLHLLHHSNQTVESLTAADCLFKAGSICLVQGCYKASQILLEICLSIQQRESSQEMAQSRNLNLNIPSPVALATTLKRLGHLYLIILLDYKKAQIHLEAALAIEESSYQGNHPELAITLNNLGLCLVRLGEHGKAEAYLQRALAMQEKNSRKSYPLMADILINLVELFQKQRESEKAKTYLERALEFEHKDHDNEDPQLAKTVHNLARCFSNLKNEQKAITFYEKALKVAENAYPANHPINAITLGNLGHSLLKLKEYKRAESYFEKALAICENGKDQNNPLLANTLDNLSSCLIDLRQYDKAKEYLERALSIREKGDNGNDPQLAGTLNNIGKCLFEKRDFDKAKAYFERALFICEKEENKNYPRQAIVISNIGECLFRQRQYEKAKESHERALFIYEKEENSLGQASSFLNIGKCLHNQKQYEKAKAYTEKALSIYEKEFDENESKLASALNGLGSCFYNLKQYEKAKPYLERALSILEKENNENDPELATTLNNLGLCLIPFHQYDQAKAYLERVLCIREKGNIETYPRLATAQYNLDYCLKEQRNYEKVKSYNSTQGIGEGSTLS